MISRRWAGVYRWTFGYSRIIHTTYMRARKSSTKNRTRSRFARTLAPRNHRPRAAARLMETHIASVERNLRLDPRAQSNLESTMRQRIERTEG